MAKPLTVKGIENLKPRADRYEVRDGAVRGLHIRVSPSGHLAWNVRYHDAGGKTRNLTIGTWPEIGLKDARDLALEVNLQIARGEDPRVAKQAARALAKAPPVRDVVETVAAQFLERHVSGLAPATVRGAKLIFTKEIIPAFRGRRLSEIERPEIVKWLDSIVDRGAPVFANRTLSWFKGFAIGRSRAA